jgi:hypothetical protein
MGVRQMGGRAALAVGVVSTVLLGAGDAPALSNLIPNGDFESGNTGFASDYVFAAVNVAEGQYFVGPNPQGWNGNLVSVADHTATGTLMFLGNGSAAADQVWFSAAPIPVIPNTDYFFEAWVMNLCCRPGAPFGNGVDPVGPSILSFFANGELLGTRTSSLLGVWEPLSTTWSSGSATSVILELVNANPEAIGNDFAIDDVFFGTESSVPEPAVHALGLAGLLVALRRVRSACAAPRGGPCEASGARARR